MHTLLFHCLAGSSLLVASAAVQAQTPATGETVVKPAPAPAPTQKPKAPSTTATITGTSTGTESGERP